ncbi:MAG: aldo/keto reductase [Nibricoccus sp.]
MIYRRFGRTGLNMPVFTCGGMRYQHKWQDVPPGEIPLDGQANVEACIERALSLGINHIETARGYGTSEMQLGRILPRLPRDKILVQTKVSPAATAAEFRANFEKSMAYLGLDHVDLFSMHGINNRQLLEWTLRPGGCLAEARKLQKEGRVRFIGFSTHATTDIILEAVETGEFDYVNLHWYFVNELNWPAVAAAKRHDMGVFIISPNDKGGKLQDRPPVMAGLTTPFTPMQFNDLFCFARPEIHTLSLGVSRPTDFDEHVAILPQIENAAKLVAPIEAKLRARMVEVHGADWCARWPEGLPHYVDVPGEINVAEIMRLWTYGQGLDLVPWAKMRYNLLGQADHWFPGKNSAKFDAAKLAPCLKHSPFAERIPDLLRQAHANYFEAPKKRLSQS